MALIKCRECGHDLSTKATHCMNCGCPNKDYNEIEDMTVDEYKEYLDREMDKFYEKFGLRSPRRGAPLWPMY